MTGATELLSQRSSATDGCYLLSPHSPLLQCPNSTDHFNAPKTRNVARSPCHSNRNKCLRQWYAKQSLPDLYSVADRANHRPHLPFAYPAAILRHAAAPGHNLPIHPDSFSRNQLHTRIRIMRLSIMTRRPRLSPSQAPQLNFDKRVPNCAGRGI